MAHKVGAAGGSGNGAGCPTSSRRSEEKAVGRLAEASSRSRARQAQLSAELVSGDYEGGSPWTKIEERVGPPADAEADGRACAASRRSSSRRLPRSRFPIFPRRRPPSLNERTWPPPELLAECLPCELLRLNLPAPVCGAGGGDEEGGGNGSSLFRRFTAIEPRRFSLTAATGSSTHEVEGEPFPPKVSLNFWN